MLVCDVDGIMTDGSIFVDANGAWKRHFNIKDGFGLVSLKKAGYKTAIITGANSDDVRLRARHLKIDYFYENRSDKIPAFQDLLVASNLEKHELAYIGDDTPDIPVLNQVGFSATAKDGHQSVLDIVKWSSAFNGGKGAVRELCDLILKYGFYSNL